MPLSLSQTGCVANIKAIRGKDETRRFLENLGFTVGQPVTVIAQLNGNLIVNVKDSRVAISQSMAVEVTVRGYELSLRKADADMILVE